MTFRAALFDVDGTLLDSLGVWQDIDRRYFAMKGMEVPEHYAEQINGLSFLQTAVYTKEHFGIAESPEEIAALWREMCREEYEKHLTIKPGVKEYLTGLKEKGVKLAVVTTLPYNLFAPALKRNGILHLFDTYATTDEGGETKAEGRIYTLAAERLGIPNADCAVFEDIPEGLTGAKKAGMTAVLVCDRRNAKSLEQSKKICDHCLESFEGSTYGY